MSRTKVWVFVVAPGEPKNYVEAYYSRLPVVGEYVTVPGNQSHFRVDMVVHPGDPSSQNEGEIFVTEIDYMNERHKMLGEG